MTSSGFFWNLCPGVQENYEGVGLAESMGPRLGIVVLDEEAKAYQSQSRYRILVLKKKDAQVPPAIQWNPTLSRGDKQVN